MDLFLPIRFRTHVQLAPFELGPDMDSILLSKVCARLEGVCSRHGYIRQGTLEIVRRSMGVCMKQHFNGHIRYELVCKGEVCNPPKGAVVEATVKVKNMLGVHAESMDPQSRAPILDIIIPFRSAGIASTVPLEEVDVGDRVYVEILGKRYQMNDRKICIIGRAVPKPSAPSSPDLPEEGLEEDGQELVDIDASDVALTEASEVGSDEEDGAIEGGSDEDDIHTGRARVVRIDEDDLDGGAADEMEEEDIEAHDEEVSDEDRDGGSGYYDD